VALVFKNTIYGGFTVKESKKLLQKTPNALNIKEKAGNGYES
jgi:hypothetical protein